MATEGDRLEELTGRLGRTVRVHRLAQGRSLTELAGAAGLSKTILARIERGEGNPSVETLWRIAGALRLSMTELVGSPAAVRTRVIPARSGERLAAEASGLSAWLMHAEPREHRSELFELGLPAGVEHAGTPHAPGTEEVVVCVAGRLAAGPAADPPVLGPGDAVHFAADVPHVYRALEDTSALNLMLYPWRAP